MAITINGSANTISGLAVGGLPDGSVDADTLASNAVTTAKVASTAITDAKIGGMASSKLSGALPAISGAALTGLSGGIDGYDIWRLTSNLTGNQMPITTSDIERADDATSTKIGTGMSVSSGVFSFPDTGIWRVTFGASVESDVDTHQNVFAIEATTNNSSYDFIARTRQGIYKMSTGTSYGTGVTTGLVDVTNTSNVKVRFEYIAGQGSEKLKGSSTENQTYFEFIRLGDT
jgi:hypothetical protein